MTSPIFFDTETCGFHGPITLIQWAEGDGPIQLYSPWKKPVIDTLKLLEKFANHPEGVIGFNLAFDWFHVQQMHSTLSRLPVIDDILEDYVVDYAMQEPNARFGQCLKPKKAFDIMLHARKGPYQSTMQRSDIRIRKVPTTIAWQLSKELETRIPLKDIYFARRKDKSAQKWQVYDITNEDGKMNIDFKDIVLKFRPSSALKVLASDALNVDTEEITLFADVTVDKKVMPRELGYAPFALAIGDKSNWKGAWPEVIRHHISHWSYNSLARKYAEDDVTYTRELYKYFGNPPMDDDDSILACMVGAIRWKGFDIDIDGIKELRKAALVLSKSAPKAPKQARMYIESQMDETEKIAFKGSTKGVILEEISKWEDDNGVHPAAIRAKEVLDARRAKKEVELYDKLIRAGRFHASFIVIGTLSSRMAGTDGLNAQGIKKEKRVRNKFPLAGDNYILCGGDFIGFEVVLADAVYNDPKLREALESGKKIHGLFGVHLYPGMTYDEILASEGTDDDKYTDSKRAVFGLLYGGDENTLHTRIGIPLDIALKAYQGFVNDYKQVGVARQKVFDMFCSMRQPGGIGTNVEWHEPSDYIENIFGFKRYFTLENRVCKTLYELANKPPRTWKNLKIKVTRRDREQTVSGAAQSALYAAAFSLQASNMRAAANHVIQSSGAQITKMLQKQIWDLQPKGVNEWVVQPMNIHDEVMCPTHPSLIKKLEEVKDKLLEDVRPKVPLIGIDWSSHLKSWADK